MSLPHVPIQSAEAALGPHRLSPAITPNPPLSVSSTTGPMPVPRPSPQGPRPSPQAAVDAAATNKIVGRNLNGTCKYKNKFDLLPFFFKIESSR